MRTSKHAAGAAIAPSSLSAAASRAVSDLLEGPSVPGVVLGASSDVAWLQGGGHVLVLSGPVSARLPNGVALAEPADALLQSGERCVVGDGRLEAGSFEVSVVRWWDPHPALPPVSPQSLAAASRQLRRLLECDRHAAQESALLSGDTVAVGQAIRGLLGKGQGLTPEGDDFLVGVLAGLRLLGPVVGARHAKKMLDSIEPIVHLEAPLRTTALSAALLRHAVVGEVAGPVAALFQSLTGRGDLGEAVDQLHSMGATSGTATACGVLLAAESLVKGGPGAR